jgi:cellulose synthase/poly-beta-1,6-N-acetylglucosamine synthase-like glycosyltransferase
VSENLPSVTVLIAARPGQAEVKAVAASRVLDYPPDKLEIIVARGKQPSAQRNAGMKAAHGELIYFLDDDSVPRPDNLKRVVPHFKRPEVKMAGGPNTCPEDAPELEQVFALVLASRLAFWSSCARYVAVGETRETSEKELILCNLIARREPMLELGGFNEALYPNEENALMDELQKRGGKLIYDPQFLVARRPRSSLKSFSRMLMTYGRGRAEQFRLHPTFGSALNFVPPLFLLYLVTAVLFFAVVPKIGLLLLVPLAFYCLAVLAQAIVLTATGHIFRSLAAIPLIALTHVLYGFGFWRGLFTKLQAAPDAQPVPVELEVVKPSGEGGSI